MPTVTVTFTATIPGINYRWQMGDCQARPRRVPALFHRSFFQELLSLANEAGAKSIILRSRERVAEVKFPEGEIDIDTREDWEELNGGSASSETMPKGRRRRKVNYADRKR